MPHLVTGVEDHAFIGREDDGAVLVEVGQHGDGRAGSGILHDRLFEPGKISQLGKALAEPDLLGVRHRLAAKHQNRVCVEQGDDAADVCVADPDRNINSRHLGPEAGSQLSKRDAHGHCPHYWRFFCV